MLGDNKDKLVTTVVPAIVITLSSTYLLNKLIRNKKASEESSNSISYTDFIFRTKLSNDVTSKTSVDTSIDNYNSLFSGVRKNVGETTSEKSIDKRKADYQELVDSYYSLCTDFYEWGWGQSFHFAPRLKGESFEHSITRAEYYLAGRAQIKPNDKVLDVGCGIGGPLRNISQFTKANITGVTLNDFQVNVGNEYSKKKGLDDKCNIVQGDFQKLKEKFDENSFDAAYAIEATCHSPNRVECFSGIFHSLKPGGLFVGYEWVVLPERGYDPTKADSIRVKEGIEVGNGIPTLTSPEDVLESLKKAGFEIIDAFDANQNAKSANEIPWYATLKGAWSISGFRMTQVGRLCTHYLVAVLELLRIAPAGSLKVSSLLSATAFDLVEGGEKEIFTPSYFFCARKPLK